jgi:hypothetical protein
VDAGGKHRRAITPIGDPVADDTAAWSPTDPTTILFEGSGTIWLANSETGRLRRLAGGWNPAWAPDGATIAAFQQGKGIVLLSLSTGSTARVSSSPIGTARTGVK